MSDLEVVKVFRSTGDLTIRPDIEGKEWMVTLWASNAAGLEVNFPRERIEKIHADLGRMLEAHNAST